MSITDSLLFSNSLIASLSLSHVRSSRMMLELLPSMSFSFVKLKCKSGFGWLSTSLKCFTNLWFCYSTDDSTLPVFDLIGSLLLKSLTVKFGTILNNFWESFWDASCSASFCILSKQFFWSALQLCLTALLVAL